jgi:hypothetical protein
MKMLNANQTTIALFEARAFQEDARDAAANAAYFVEHGLEAEAVRSQRAAAFFAAAAAFQMVRLIGA